MFLLDLNKTIIATPLPVSNPAIQVPKLIAPFKNNSVNAILAPQFGNNPIKEPINGPNKL